jgi:hypothetical protein
LGDKLLLEGISGRPVVEVILKVFLIGVHVLPYWNEILGVPTVFKGVGAGAFFSLFALRALPQLTILLTS